MLDVRTAAGYAVFAVFALVVLAALGSWLVRTRRISPFGALGRGLRSATDWIIMPVERRLVRMGGNPVHAGGWLVVLAAVAGVIFLSILGWGLTTYGTLQGAVRGGPRVVLAVVIELAYNVLILALIVRVIGTWIGVFRYTWWMRPAYTLTDWVVEPLRRFVPPLGAMDVSPLVAWLVLWLLKKFLLMGLSL
ncbi:MAG TPA: YggT family protein [Gemmatimonadales bacterium]|jgi:YggT family protein|nr:YggT family protein [Gemmatimonadales bacterium]